MKTPLATWHTAHGAKLIDDRGVELPERFTDPVEEYRAVRGKAGLIDLSFRSQIRMTGEDRAGFLQGMVSNDIKALTPGDGCMATLLTEQGRIVADLRVYALESCFLLDVDARIKDRMMETLSRFIIADDVEMEDLCETQVTIALQGPLASQVLAAVGATISLAQEFQHCETVIDGVSVSIIHASDTGEEGYEIIAPYAQVETVWRALLASGEGVGLQPVGLTALNILRIEAGIPWYGIDMDEGRIVLEIGFEQAISFKKGCYLGQEVVERATARGHVNRKLSGLIVQDRDSPMQGDKVFHNEQEVGWVTSVAQSPRLGKPIALGYIRREHLAQGTQLRIDRQGTPMIAEVTSLPFPW
ncbi:MAG: aminomethyltransferase family protein [Candidatus Binatia bacterium]